MSAPAPPPNLTAILVADPVLDEEEVRRAVAARGPGESSGPGAPGPEVWLRIRPLPALGLSQVELFDALGWPCLDPALVAELSRGRRATFVHVDARAEQAFVHGFSDGQPVEEAWLGRPTPGDELDRRLERVVGAPLSAIAAADDGTRWGIGHAASGTVALVRGRALAVPVGLPTLLGSFGFHDRRGRGEGSPSDGAGERVALLAFDAGAVERAWRTVPGAELAARIETLPDRLAGPVRAARPAVVAALAELGDRTPEAAGLRSVQALELVALAEACFFAGGDETGYLDERVLPMFTLTTGDPPLDDPDEAEELEGRESVLAAMVEVLPYGSPEGEMLEQLEDEEVRPLAPWAVPGEEYVGSLFLLRADRLRGLLLSLDERDLAARVDRFYRAWWKAQTDDPAGPAFEAWRRGLDEKGAPDVERFLADWTEWRTVLALAEANRLQTALLFYGVHGS